MSFAPVLSGAVLLTLLAGCADAAQPSPPVAVASSPVGAQASRPVPDWTEPPAYTYVLTTGCTRGFNDARYRVTVKDGEVVSAVGLEQQAKAHPDHPVPTLGELAAWAVAAQAKNSQVRYDRDPVDGHPVAAGFAHDAMAVDAGECFRVSEYHPG
jgi:hypothetical protein